ERSRPLTPNQKCEKLAEGFNDSCNKSARSRHLQCKKHPRQPSRRLRARVVFWSVKVAAAAVLRLNEAGTRSTALRHSLPIKSKIANSWGTRQRSGIPLVPIPLVT